MSYNPVILPQIKVAFQQLMPLLEKLRNPTLAKGHLKELVANIRAKKQVIDGLKRQLSVPHLKKSQYNEKDWQKLEDSIKQLEEKLNTAGDDAQLANVDMQNLSKQQQQALEKMASVAKVLTDTATSIVKKIG